MSDQKTVPLPNYTTGKCETHNAMTLRAPPGARFSFAPGGADVIFQFPRGKEEEMLDYLRKWIDSYGVYELNREHPGVNLGLKRTPVAVQTQPSIEVHPPRTAEDNTKEILARLGEGPKTDAVEQAKGALDESKCVTCGKFRNFTLGGKLHELCVDCYDAKGK